MDEGFREVVRGGRSATVIIHVCSTVYQSCTRCLRYVCPPILASPLNLADVMGGERVNSRPLQMVQNADSSATPIVMALPPKLFFMFCGDPHDVFDWTKCPLKDAAHTALEWQRPERARTSSANIFGPPARNSALGESDVNAISTGEETSLKGREV